MRNEKKLKEIKNRSSAGNIDEGHNETTRLPYTDSISTLAGTSRDSIMKRK